MANVNKKDLVAAIKEEHQASGKISRKSTSRKTQDGKEQAINLFYVCDQERKSASKKFLVTLKPVWQAYKQTSERAAKIAAYIESKTNNFTSLVLPENENGDKYKNQVKVGRKNFGVLDYFPTNEEQLLEVLAACRLLLKEERVSQQEQEREQAKQERKQEVLESASEQELLAALAKLQAAKKSKK